MSEEEQTEYIVQANLGEVKLEAIAFFEEQFNENKAICAAWGRVYWELYDGIGYLDDEHTFSGDCKLISDWLDELSFPYAETTAYDAKTDEELWSNDERIYANDFKVKLMGKEVAAHV